MVNYIEYIIDELQTCFGASYNVVSAVNSIYDLANQSNKYNVLIEIVSDTKTELDNERYLNKVRKADLTFMLYIGFNIKSDIAKSGAMLSKQAEIWNELLKTFIDTNWTKTDVSADFRVNIHNTQLIDYYPINSQTDGNAIIGITGNVNYSLIRL